MRKDSTVACSGMVLKAVMQLDRSTFQTTTIITNKPELSVHHRALLLSAHLINKSLVILCIFSAKHVKQPLSYCFVL